METYGELKKVIKNISLKQKGQKVGNIALDAVIGTIPGIGAAKTTFDFFKAAFKKPDDKKTSSWLDKLDVDDEMSDIVDDTVENGFLKAVASSIEKKSDEEKLDPNFDMNEKMVKYLGDKYKGRTITGIKENKNKMKKQQLKNLIKEEIKSLLKEEDSPESSEVKIPSALIKLVKDLGVGDKITIVNQALALIAKGKESELSRIQNEQLAKILIALLKNTDASLGNKFLQLSKQIK
ncbi:DUF4112 domain-containing protein [bacterium]|nr:DUF4112 domain-containing protein [bacterium]